MRTEWAMDDEQKSAGLIIIASDLSSQVLDLNCYLRTLARGINDTWIHAIMNRQQSSTLTH